MTAADDYVQFEVDGAVVMRGDAPSWPPPERLWLFTLYADNTALGATPDDGHLAVGAGFIERSHDAERLAVTPFKRVSHSQISDADIAEMTHVARGAMYVPELSVRTGTVPT